MNNKALVEALRAFIGAAYPVAGEINPRGHNWSEAYLDEALTLAKAALASSGNEAPSVEDRGLVEALVCNCKDAHGNKPRADCPYCNGTNIIADSPGLDGYEPKRKVGASGYGWLAGAIDPNATEAEKLRLELYCMNERRKTQVAQTRYHRDRADALEQELTALSSGNEVAKVVGWQPIGTAPKDGTPILVFFNRPDLGAMRVTWDSPHYAKVTPENGIWCVDDNKHGPYPVRGYSEGDDTHWQPLPLAPDAAPLTGGDNG